mmetsp:Transcript_98275/g.174976  ORF Transcript_98275/g.174976 Transcript_98275/m.174976 type:complete len:842 (-) Transcript_98275:55-2580(-)
MSTGSVRGRSVELEEKLQKFGRRAESGSPADITRSSRSYHARAQDAFRSGWSHSPQVTPPLSFVPQGQAERIGRRYNSAPSPTHLMPSEGFVSRASSGLNVTLSFADRVVSRSSSPAGIPKRDSGSCYSDEVSIESGASRELFYEGWLAKLTSGKLSARWQQRFFRLEGCKLVYMNSPGAATKRSFDIRRSKRISAVEGQPRELELNFGYRSWRLRANSPESAHRWLLLLEAAKLVGGAAPDDEATEMEGSDDDSASSISTHSTTTAASTTSYEPGTPKFGAMQKASLQPVKAISELLELDPKELDARFEAWLPVLKDKQVNNSTNPFEAAASTNPFEAEVEAEASMCDGLRLALNGLWSDLATGTPASSMGSSQHSGVQAALEMLSAAGATSEPSAVRELLESFVGEYLDRMRDSIQRWIEECDPMADEVADVAKWFLFEASPSLGLFEAGAARLVGEAMEQISEAATALERLLLREWETRSCDEAFWLCQEAFESCRGRQARIDQVLHLLEAAAAGGQDWRGHRAALDSSASVLIATLNATLRAYRLSVRQLLLCVSGKDLEEPEIQERPRGRRRRVTRALTRFGKQALQEIQKAGSCTDASQLEAHPPTAEMLALAVLQAAELSSFCEAAVIEAAWGSSASLCKEVLAAFSGAFESEAKSLCWALSKLHFEKQKSQEIKAAGARTMGSGCEGTLGSAVTSALRFRDELLPIFASGGDAAGGGNHIKAIAAEFARSLLGRALAKLLASAWMGRFSQLQRPPGASWLEAALAADIALLAKLVSPKDSAVLAPLQHLQELLELGGGSNEPAKTAVCQARLEALLGHSLGSRLVHIVAGLRR